MRVKTLKRFLDKKAKKTRLAGEEFELSKARFSEINSAGYGVLIEEIKEAKKSKEAE